MKSAKKNKVGFIGLGIMGKPMVINLIKNDIEVYFYARKKRIIDEISKIGGKFIPNPSDISKFTKIILTNLPNTKDVENIVIGKNGIINNLQTGSIVIDMSTISPEGTRYINDKLRSRKSYLVDAPVSGGEAGAKSGKLSIMVGLKLEFIFCFHLTNPFLESIAKNSFLLLEKYINPLLKTKSEFFKEKAFS